MGCRLQKNHKNIFYTVLLFFTFLFISCAQTVPELSAVNYSVVFDYVETSDYPSARLCVFIESKTDVRRYDSLKVVTPESDLFWLVENLELFTKNGKEWLGYSNLTLPQEKELSEGAYKAILISADEKEASSDFNLTYNKDLYKIRKNDVAQYFANRNGVLNTAVFDEEHVLLYYGAKKSEWKQEERILLKYPTAKSFREVWISSDNKEICILPEKNIEFEKEVSQ